MCTSISWTKGDHYFGRNLDLEGSFGEGVAFAPRNLDWKFKKVSTPRVKKAMIGMAIVRDGFPLYYDAVNENGLSMSGLNFPKNAVYQKPQPKKYNLAPYEFIPYVLLTCKNLNEARELVKEVTLIDEPFGKDLPLTPLHFMISDKTGSIIAEPTEEGLMIYEDPVGVLTNNPPFPMQLQRLDDFINLTPYEPTSRFSENLELKAYSRGMGALGLPGDSSSASRFARAVFARSNLVAGESEEEKVGAFFHMLQNVAMVRGLVRLKEGVYEETVYSSCCNTDKGIYYYTTYGDQAVNAVDMHREDLEGETPVFYPLSHSQEICFRN